MPAGQREAGFLVTGQREMSGTELGNTVALLAAILIWRRRKLALMNILMATAAFYLSDPKHGVLTLWDMAFFAFHFRMPAFEWIAARSMFLNSESRRLEPIHRMTDGAISAAGPRQELALVIIGMASRARRVSYRRLEVTASVASAARHAAVLPEKRKSGL
jgi:hypothetical protein